MRYQEIISERSLADVGVGTKFYLSAKGEQIDFDKFFATGKLDHVKGVSSSKTIWADFGPGMSRDLFFIMPAQDTLRLNKMHRIGYDNADDLIANNSYKLGRILTLKDVSKGGGDNLINGSFPKIPQVSYRDDPISVLNHAMSIARALGQRGERGGLDRFENIDKNSFGNWKENGLQLNTIADYANLFHQAGKSAGWYGKDHAKFFAPQNRAKWEPAIRAAITRQANVYADESEWVIDSDEFTVPPSSYVILAIPQKYMEPKPPEDEIAKKPYLWNSWDDKYMAYYQNLMEQFKKSSYNVKIVEAGKASNQLIVAKTKRRAATSGE